MAFARRGSASPSPPPRPGGAAGRRGGAARRGRVAGRARLGGVPTPPARAGGRGERGGGVVLSRGRGGTRRWVATVVGTVFAQTLLNILALALLAAVALAGTGLFQGR